MNVPKFKKEKPKFDFDIRVIDIYKDPEIIVKKVSHSHILCKDCSSRYTIKITDEFITQQCHCGTRIIYPKGDRPYYISKFISKAQYEKNKEGNQF